MSRILEIREFNELSVEELYALLQLRCEVFIVEQACAYADIDGKDRYAKHVLLFDGKGEILGALRILREGQDEMTFKIGRVVVSKVARGQGIARQLMDAALTYCRTTDGEADVELQAQAYLQAFYGACGFYAISDVYPEDGIPHVDMRLIKTAEA